MTRSTVIGVAVLVALAIGDERHSESQSGPPGRQPEQRVSSPPVGTLSTAPDVADSRNQNSKPEWCGAWGPPIAGLALPASAHEAPEAALSRLVIGRDSGWLPQGVGAFALPAAGDGHAAGVRRAVATA